jgi:hypothetical protein
MQLKLSQELRGLPTLKANQKYRQPVKPKVEINVHNGLLSDNNSCNPKEAATETSIYFQTTKRRYVPGNGILHNHRCGNLTPYMLWISSVFKICSWKIAFIGYIKIHKKILNLLHRFIRLGDKWEHGCLLMLTPHSAQPLDRRTIRAVSHPNFINKSTMADKPHGADPFPRGVQLCRYSGTSQHSMELEDSLTCLRELSTGPYPEPGQCPIIPSYLSNIHLNTGCGKLTSFFEYEMPYEKGN